MNCPFCSRPDTRVVDSRLTDEGAAVRRRRECPRCGRRFTTYERVEEAPLMVVKKDGRREPFSRQKVLAGVMKACEKRPVPMAVMEELVDRVERAAREQGESEVSSRFIGERVMEELRRIDPVAYVRFASVYREFKDVTGFVAEVEQLLGRRGGRNRRAPVADPAAR